MRFDLLAIDRFIRLKDHLVKLDVRKTQLIEEIPLIVWESIINFSHSSLFNKLHKKMIDNTYKIYYYDSNS